MTINPQEFALKLQALNNTQKSVESTSKWFQTFKENTKDAVKLWFKEFRRAPEKQKLAFIHLVNDVVQSTMLNAPQFGKLFEPVLPTAFNETARIQKHSVRSGLAHLLIVWADRRVYSKTYLRQLRQICQQAAANADHPNATEEVQKRIIAASPFAFSFSSLEIAASLQQNSKSAMKLERIKAAIKNGDTSKLNSIDPALAAKMARRQRRKQLASLNAANAFTGGASAGSLSAGGLTGAQHRSSAMMLSSTTKPGDFMQPLRPMTTSFNPFPVPPKTPGGPGSELSGTDQESSFSNNSPVMSAQKLAATQDFREQLQMGLQTDAVKPPETTELIAALESLNTTNPAYADATIRRDIAKFPQEISDPTQAGEMIAEDPDSADDLIRQISQSSEKLESYNRRLDEESTAHQQLVLNIAAYRQSKAPSHAERDASRLKLAEIDKKLAQMEALRKALDNHLSNLPDLALLPGMPRFLAPLPTVNDLFG